MDEATLEELKRGGRGSYLGEEPGEEDRDL